MEKEPKCMKTKGAPLKERYGNSVKEKRTQNGGATSEEKEKILEDLERRISAIEQRLEGIA